MAIEQTLLFDKLHASLLAAAIGDAMGGPVEGLDYQQIQKEYGVVNTLLPYSRPPDYHSQFRSEAGTVTDDTRLIVILCQAIRADGDVPLRGDFLKALTDAYYASQTELWQGFLEEYVLGGLYGGEKLIWGGQPTNGFIMANSPLGLVCPCDPPAAFRLSLQLDFISDGYARYSSAIAAAAVAAALRPGANIAGVIEEALSAAHAHRREGKLTREWKWYEHVFQLNERLIKTAAEIGGKYNDILAVRTEFYEQLTVSPLGSEAAQSLAVALGMLVAARGDLARTIVGCVNYGRDNDSYACIAGSIAGALNGTAAIPPEWRAGVEHANPEIDFYAMAGKLAETVSKRQAQARNTVNQVEALLGRAG